MHFKDLVDVVKGAIAAGVKREAKIVLDVGRGPMLEAEGVKAILQTQQLVIVAGKPKKPPKVLKVLPGQRAFFDIWDGKAKA